MQHVRQPSPSITIFHEFWASLPEPFCRYIPRNYEHSFAEQQEPAKRPMPFRLPQSPRQSTQKLAPRILPHHANDDNRTPFTSKFSDVSRQLAFVGVAGSFRDRDLGDKRSAMTTCHSLDLCCAAPLAVAVYLFLVEKV